MWSGGLGEKIYELGKTLVVLTAAEWAVEHLRYMINGYGYNLPAFFSNALHIYIIFWLYGEGWITIWRTHWMNDIRSYAHPSTAK